jgi:hypothetical protein
VGPNHTAWHRFGLQAGCWGQPKSLHDSSATSATAATAHLHDRFRLLGHEWHVPPQWYMYVPQRVERSALQHI